MISKWDIRIRVLAVLIWLVGVLFFKQIASCWILTGILFLTIALDQKMQLSKAMHQLKHIAPFVILVFVTLSISDGIPLEKEAVHFAALVTSRVITSLLLVLAMISGDTVDAFIQNLSVLPIPKIYLSLLLLVNRYVVLLTKDFQKQRMALRSRMFVPTANLGVLKNIGYVIGGMFIRGYDRSEIVYDAMRARCYNGVVPIDHPERVKVVDYMKLVVAILIYGCVLWGERMFGG